MTEGCMEGLRKGMGRGEVHSQPNLTCPTQSRVSSCGNVDNPVGDLIVGLVDAPIARPRHPVIRTGERERLSETVRLAVIRRDSPRCKECADWLRYPEIEIDHIKPWSAGGADTTDNLRVLCRSCNQKRSNYIDPIAESRSVLPATWWCVDCAEAIAVLPQDPKTLLFAHLEVDPAIADDTQRSCSDSTWCAKSWWQIASLATLPEPVLAFCGHCYATAYTPWPL